VRVSRASRITLREITPPLRAVVSQLAVRGDQARFVAPNAKSLERADADEGAWMRAIFADETPVGFVLLHEENLRAQPAARELFLHHVPAEGSAEGFYKRLGFEHTGVLAHGELEMRLAL
jgi:diamine N-acetyltransferase